MFTKTEISKDEILLEVEGSLSGEATDDFQQALEELTEGRHHTLTLNLARVKSINSSSIGKILLCKKKLSDQSREIRIRGCSDALFNTFQLIRFDKLVNVEK